MLQIAVLDFRLGLLYQIPDSIGGRRSRSSQEWVQSLLVVTSRNSDIFW